MTVCNLLNASSSRARLQRFTENAGPNDELTEREASFIALRDTFYLASVNEDGWPYVQRRGGPAGLLRVVGPTCLAYADFRGNTQLVGVGNVSSNYRTMGERHDTNYRNAIQRNGRYPIQRTA